MNSKVQRWHPTHTAWLVLILSCGISLLFCTTISFTIYSYFFRSTTPMAAYLQVTRGTVVISSPASMEESAERIARDISSMTIISTDEQSLSTLSFSDDQGSLYAHITSRPETQVTLARSARPRFSMGGNDIFIELSELNGRLDVLIIDRPDYDVRVRVLGPAGAAAILSYPGRYEIAADAGGLQIINHNALFAQIQGEEQTRLVPKGFRGAFSTAAAAEITIEREYTNLINDPSYERYFEFLADDSVENARWSCINFTEVTSDVLGQFRNASIDGLETMRFIRSGEIKGHGETRCFYQFLGGMGEIGINVSEYDYLGMQATILIHGQSLSRCGFKGSECPVMLRIDYTDREGNAKRWFQGFFIPHAEDSEQDNPLRCSDCPALHERIGAKTWYPYDSGNLFSIFPDDARPEELISLQVYASGHEYDVFISEITLQVKEFPAPETESSS